MSSHAKENRVGAPDAPTRLLLIRHAEVASHDGDVPITQTGQTQARRVGAWLHGEDIDVCAVLYGGTRRTRDSAQGVAAGLAAGRPNGGPMPVVDSFALRNPDLYLGGQRVTMVSTAEAFAEQVPCLESEDVLAVPFFAAWLRHPERVGFWVGHQRPPGDTAHSVAQRIESFARSFADVPAWRGRTVVGVTHSPVLRSIGLTLAGTDPGEPPYLHGYAFAVPSDGAIDVTPVAPTTS